MFTILLSVLVLLAGLSDPYCVLGVVHLTKDQQASWQKGGKMKKLTDGMKDTVSTTVRPKTLTPIWEEEYDL